MHDELSSAKVWGQCGEHRWCEGSNIGVLLCRFVRCNASKDIM